MGCCFGDRGKECPDAQSVVEHVGVATPAEQEVKPAEEAKYADDAKSVEKANAAEEAKPAEDKIPADIHWTLDMPGHPEDGKCVPLHLVPHTVQVGTIELPAGTFVVVQGVASSTAEHVWMLCAPGYPEDGIAVPSQYLKRITVDPFRGSLPLETSRLSVLRSAPSGLSLAGGAVEGNVHEKARMRATVLSATKMFTDKTGKAKLPGLQNASLFTVKEYCNGVDMRGAKVDPKADALALSEALKDFRQRLASIQSASNHGTVYRHGYLMCRVDTRAPPKG